MNSLANKKFLVIGGMGFVGSHVVTQLLKENPAEIRVFDNAIKRENLSEEMKSQKIQLIEGSLTDFEQVKKAARGVDYVFHLAALWLGECVANPRRAVEVNVLGTYNVVEACHAEGVKRVVFSSSASVYGNAVQTPMTEDHPFLNRSMYGATKIAGEQFFRAFYEANKLSYVGLRYMNVYGERMAEKGQFASVIVKILDKIDRGEAPVIHGDGSQSFDFVHVTDVARANILAMKSETNDEFFNVGTGKGTSINDLNKMLLRLSGSKLEPQYLPQEKMFVTHRIGNPDKAAKLIGFKATIPLEEGMKAYVAWRRKLRQGAVTS
jgi:UDP-glucose 4-epimerase